MHGMRCEIRLRITETYCTVCGLENHCRNMMMNHLDRSPICHANVMAQPVVMTEEECRPFDDECRLRRQKNKKTLEPKSGSGTPCVRRLGPFLPVVNLDGTIILTKNGHPLSDNHPWHRSPELMGCDESLSLIGCPASLRAPCKSACLLCTVQQ